MRVRGRGERAWEFMMKSFTVECTPECGESGFVAGWGHIEKGG